MTHKSNLPLVDWSVDQVVDEFCYKEFPSWVLQGHKDIPNKAQLEPVLRANDVDGSLLTELNYNELKNELNITSLGQRKAFERALRFLRGETHPSITPARALSLHEKVHKYQDGIKTPDVCRPSPYGPSTTCESIIEGTRQADVHDCTDTTIVPSEELLTTFGTDRNLDNHLNDITRFKAVCAPLEYERHHARRSNSPLVPYIPIEGQVSCQPRPSLAVDVSSQRDTSVDFFKTKQSTDNSRVANILDTLDASIDSKLRPNAVSRNGDTGAVPQAEDKDTQTVNTRSKRHIAPTFVRHIQRPLEANTATTPTDDRQSLRPYLSKEILSMQGTFYGNDFDSDQDFLICNRSSPCGTSLVVNRRLRHFWLQKSRAIHTLPYDAFCKLPYPVKACAGPLSEPLFTLFVEGSTPTTQKLSDWSDIERSLSRSTRKTSNLKTPPDTIVAVRDGTAFVQSVQTGNKDEAGSDLGDFAYLLEKYPVASLEQDILPIYGESGDENDFDDETWHEIEEERKEQEAKFSFLTPDQVTSALMEAVDEIREAWRLRKLPKVQLKAYRLWMKLAKAKKRAAELDAYYALRSHKHATLTKMKELIVKDNWRKVEDVKAQCGALEETVFAIMEAEHMLQVLHQNTPPEKPAVQPVKQKARGKPELPADEESLDSDSEIEWEKPMTDFVVKDTDFSILDDSRDEDFAQFIPKSPAKRVGAPVSAQTAVGNDDAPYVPNAGLPTDLLPWGDSSDVEMQDLRYLTTQDLSSMNFDTTSTHDDADAESEAEVNKFLSPSNKVTTPKKKYTPRRIIKHLDRSHSPASPHAGYSDDEYSDLDARPRLPPSKYKGQGNTRESAIELISSPARPESESSGGRTSIATPPLNPASSESDQGPLTRRGTKLRFTIQRSVTTPPATDTSLADRVSGLDAALRSLSTVAPKELPLLVKFLPPKTFHTNLRALLSEALITLRRHGIFQINQLTPSESSTVEWLTKLFISFVQSKDVVRTSASCADIDLTWEDRKLYDRDFEKELKKLLHFVDHGKQLADTPQQDDTMMKNERGIKRKHEQLDPSDIPETGSDDSGLIEVGSYDEQAEHRTPHKKRKKKIAESEEARAVQQNDQARIREREYRRQLLIDKMEHVDTGNSGAVVINSIEPPVLLDNHIARRVKPHQIQGIQFLWREIVEDPRQQGCLLAHTMGLGKTMQVISLLVSIAQCAASQEPNVVNHVPEKLRLNKTLILCPPSLIENWFDELLMWSPANDPRLLDELYKISGRAATNDEYFKRWAENGGVLIISYDTLRSLVTPSYSSKQEHLEKVPQYEKWLLETPSLVVADEAHKLKNSKSKISVLAQRFKTKSRIALSGSPLNNHLEEYHTMVEWIAPGYLGDLAQFRQKYVDPINAGLYADSTAYERRLCLRKLHTLKKDIEPKVNRADINAIHKDLPPKVEYIITIPLKEAQRQAYDTYVAHLLKQHDKRGQTSSQGLFKSMNNLMVLAAHPSCFVKVFQAHAKLDGKSYESSTDAEQSEYQSREKLEKFSQEYDPLRTEKVAPSDLDAERAAVEVFKNQALFEALDDPHLSYRTAITKKLVEKAVGLGDKTLVFSHSIPTLDYLEKMLKEIDPHLMRIDGMTKIPERQEKTKTFNKSSGSNSKIILISTKAGGLGLNLQGANRVIVFDSGFNPMWEEQAVGRAYRLGQLRDVFVYRFKCGGTFEEPIHNKALFKTQLFQRVVDKKNPTRAAAKSVSQYLFQSKDVVKCDFKQYLGKDPNVLDEVVDEVDQICNLELTETFQRDDGEELSEEELKLANAEQEDERLRREDPERWKQNHGLVPTQIPRVSSGTGTGTAKNTPFKGKMQPSVKVFDQQVSQVLEQSRRIGTKPAIDQVSSRFNGSRPQGQIDGAIDLVSDSDDPARSKANPRRSQ